MAKALKIFSMRGAPVRLHWSLVFLPLFLLYQPLVNIMAQPNLFYWACARLGFLCLAIIAHELAHIITAKSFGAAVDDVIIYPFGGDTQVNGMPADEWYHVRLALSGPLFNLSIASIIYAVTTLFLAEPSPVLSQIMIWNLVIGVFNMIPAQPLDGGQALRRALNAKIGYIRGDLWAGRIGVFIGCILMAAGFFLNFIFFIIGIITAAASYNVIKQTRYIMFDAPWAGGTDDIRSWRLPTGELQEEIRRRKSFESANADMRKRVDDLLRKISESGFDSLNDEERHFLKMASERLRMKRP